MYAWYHNIPLLYKVDHGAPQGLYSLGVRVSESPSGRSSELRSPGQEGNPGTSIAQDAQEQVSRYLADGFKPVRLRANTKRPFEERWQIVELSEEELHEWVREGGAIGLQMGRVSGWVGCVDLDWEEARWLAPRFLRPTLMGAKGSEAPSQYFYRCAGLPYAKFSGIKRSKGAEILSVKASDENKGHQVCVSPSVHEVKGPYLWVDGYDAARIAEEVRGVLQHQVSLLATASLIARELPASREEGGGGRHEFAMALSGYLLRGGLAEDDVRDVLVGAWEYRRAPAEAITDVEAAVRDTAATIRAGGKATGGPTVDDVVDGLSGKLSKFLSLSLGQRPDASVASGAPMYLKPPIEVEDTTLQEAGDRALQALLDHNDPPKMFTRGGVPIRLMHDPREDEPLIQEITVDRMRFEIAQAADFIKSTKNTSKYVFPSRDLVTYVRSHTGTAKLPAFVGVTRCPVVRPDGTFLLEAGFDKATGLWFAPQEGLKIPRVSKVPSREEVEEALRIAWQQIADFPFVDRASAANILAFPLTLILRPAIEGHVPLLLVDKPEVGTGASLMVDMLSMAILGKSAGAVGAPGDDDAEMRKLITGALRHSRQIVFFDNVATELRHTSLARALTISFWEDRILGHSVVVRLPQRAVWAATGNNVSLSSEIARRTFKVRLDAKQDRPWEGREFAIPDLNRWTKQNRGRLLWAYLTLTRHYFAEGRPTPEVKPIGMFEEWTEVVGGVLEAAGIHNFLANREELYETTTDAGADWYAFLSAWRGAYGESSKTTKALVGDLYATSDDSFNDLRTALPDDFGSIDPSRPDRLLSRRLGNAFRERVGKRFGTEGLHLVRAGSSHPFSS
jgi:Bifunctional DNA primase/polymerase, N-terminal